jgi:hypothetical protein
MNKAYTPKTCQQRPNSKRYKRASKSFAGVGVRTSMSRDDPTRLANTWLLPNPISRRTSLSAGSECRTIAVKVEK